MASAAVKPEKIRRCSDHSGLVARIDQLREDVLEERKHRETAFTALNHKLDTQKEEIVKLKISMAKIFAGVGVLLAVVQIVLKFIPAGGG